MNIFLYLCNEIEKLQVFLGQRKRSLQISWTEISSFAKLLTLGIVQTSLTLLSLNRNIAAEIE